MLIGFILGVRLSDDDQKKEEIVSIFFPPYVVDIYTTHSLWKKFQSRNLRNISPSSSFLQNIRSHPHNHIPLTINHFLVSIDVRLLPLGVPLNLLLFLLDPHQVSHHSPDEPHSLQSLLGLE